jgi:hypothetical protein
MRKDALTQGKKLVLSDRSGKGNLNVRKTIGVFTGLIRNLSLPLV